MDTLHLDAYWLVLWEPRYKTLKSVGQVGCVFATEKEARQMLAAWPGGEVFEVVRRAGLAPFVEEAPDSPDDSEPIL